MSDPVPDSRASFRRRLAAPLAENPVLLGLCALLWTLAWMALEGVFLRQGVASWMAALAPLVACAALAAAWRLADPGGWRRLLASPLLAWSLGGILVLALLGGAAVVKLRGGEVPAGGFPEAAVPFLATRRLADLGRSLWLESLLLPLAGLAGAWSLRGAGAPRLGRGLVAAGTLLLAGSSLWNQARALRVAAWLAPGASAGVFQGGRSGAAPLTLPGFRVRLASLDPAAPGRGCRLALLPKGAVEGGPEAWTCRVESGQTGPLPGGLRYRVEKLIPDAAPSGQVVEDPRSPVNPAAQVMLGLGNAEPLVGFLFADDPGGWRRDEPQGRFAVVYRERFTPDLLKDLAPHPPERQWLELTFMGKTLEHPVAPGAVWRLPGFTLTVTGIYPEFGGIHKGAGGKPEPYSLSPVYRNPWIQVELRQDSGAQAPLLLSERPVQDKDYLAYLARTLPPGMTLQYLTRGEETQDLFVLLTRQDGKARLVQDGRVVREADATVDKPFVVAKGLSVTVLARYDHARFEPDFVPEPDPGPHPRPVLRLRVWDPATGAVSTHWLQARGPEGRPVAASFLGGRVRLAYRPAGPAPDALRGTVEILDPAGQVLAQGPVTLGSAFAWGGFRFYADGWAPGPPPELRLLAVRDPGPAPAWIALVLLVAGGLWLRFAPRRSPA